MLVKLQILILRLQQHNYHYFKTSFTRSAGDWILNLSYKCDKKTETFVSVFCFYTLLNFSFINFSIFFYLQTR